MYSRPVWLQVFKRGAVDNSLQFGQLIGGKLYAPPAMTSAQLEEVRVSIPVASASSDLPSSNAVPCRAVSSLQQARVAAMKEAEQDRLSRSVVGGAVSKDTPDPIIRLKGGTDSDGEDSLNAGGRSIRARRKTASASVSGAQLFYRRNL